MIYTKKENIKIWSRKLEWSGMREAGGLEWTTGKNRRRWFSSSLDEVRTYHTSKVIILWVKQSIEEIEMVAIKKWIIVFVENWPWDN